MGLYLEFLAPPPHPPNPDFRENGLIFAVPKISSFGRTYRPRSSFVFVQKLNGESLWKPYINNVFEITIQGGLRQTDGFEKNHCSVNFKHRPLLFVQKLR